MIYKSNLSDVLTRLKADLLAPVEQHKLARTIATTLYASNLQRVFTDGKKVNEQKIGSYSTKPIYVNPSRSPVKFSPKTRVKRNPKTRYFAGGYKGFRGYIHRETAFVNLNLSHKLKTDFRMLPTKTGWAIGFATQYGATLSVAHEKRYGGDIWGISPKESRQVDVIAQNFVNKLTHAKH